MAELAGVLVGNYFLLECLAREGTVETYRARPTTRGGYDVVLRLYRPGFPDPTSFRERFATEVEKVWRCSHEHIQPLLEFGAGDDLLYTATLITEAETLEQFLERHHGHFLPMTLVLRFVAQLCDALQYVHEQGIVHGNIQPSSILVRNETEVLLSAFGMRRAYQDGEPCVAQIGDGNPAYTAPEQALGMVRPTSDIYGLGILLYRLLGGSLPFADEMPEEIALKHTDEPMPSLRALRPEVPEALEMVVRVALSKNPEARFPTPAALARALHAAVVPESPHIVSATPQRRIIVRSQRTPFTWARAVTLITTSLLLLGLIGASFFIFSLPQLRGSPFWNNDPTSVAGNTPASSSTTARSTPVHFSGTPTIAGTTYIGGSHIPQPVPTRGKVQTPIAGSTATPLSPPSASFNACIADTLSIDGSSNLEPELQQVSNDYAAQCPGVVISLGGGGSRKALNSLQQNQIDAAASDLTARPARNLTDHAVAALLYAIIVSPDVAVGGLSRTAIQGIYQHQITNWSQVGGQNEAITVILHPSNDSVNAIFHAFVLNGADEHVKGIKLKKDWAQAVAQTPGAISYVPLSDVQGANVTVMAIDGIAPSTEALLNNTYPFWSVEHLYTQGESTPLFQAYVSFFNTEQEAAKIIRFAAVPINMLPQSILVSHLPGPEI